MINFPLIYDGGLTPANKHCFGMLSDCAKCSVKEERNGAFELELTYPINGTLAEKIEIRNLIYCKPSTKRGGQYFRIYKITKRLDGLMIVNAEHISYDLLGFVVGAFNGNGIADALTNLASHIQPSGTCDFTFSTDLTSTAAYRSYIPASARAILGGTENSLLDVYGGELLFDNFNVSLLKNRGVSVNTFIAQGTNLLSYDREVNSENFVTGYKPFWAKQKDDGSYIYRITNPAIIYTDGTGVNPYGFEKNIPMDLSDEFEYRPTQIELTNLALQKINEAGMISPAVSVNIDYEDLSTAEGGNVDELIDLCDIVTVRNAATETIDQFKVTAIDYNVLQNRYNDVSFGEARANAVTQIADLQSAFVAEKAKIATGKVDRELGQTPVTSCAAQAVTQFDITFAHAYTPNNCIVGTELYRTSSNRYVGLSTLSRGPLVTDADGNVIGITCYIANNHTAAQNFRIDWFVIGEMAE